MSRDWRSRLEVWADERLNGTCRWEDGAEDGVRTRGLLLGKEMLYH